MISHKFKIGDEIEWGDPQVDGLIRIGIITGIDITSSTYIIFGVGNSLSSPYDMDIVDDNCELSLRCKRYEYIKELLG